MPALLAAGWGLETAPPVPMAARAEELQALSAQIPQVGLGAVLEPYMDTVFKIRDLGIAYSDRRAVKSLKLVAASALLCGRQAANVSDLWVLRYVWDREEQIDALAALINGVLEQHAREPDRHPLAAVPAQPDGEDLARQLDEVDKQLQDKTLSLAALARVKERIAAIADQAAWLAEVNSRKFLLERARRCLEQIG